MKTPVVAAAVCILLPALATAQEKQSLAEQAVDPTASLMSLQFSDNYTTDIWQQEGTSNEVLFRAAIPMRVWNTSNIFRSTATYTTGGVRGAGIESVQLFDLVVFTEEWGRWGVGPLVSFQRDYGRGMPGPFAAGFAVGFTMKVGRWTLGLFNQNLFGREIAVSQLQPIIAYQLGDGWTLSVGDAQYPFDWNAGELAAAPLSIQLGKVTQIAGQPVRFFVNPQYNLVNKAGADRWTIGAGFSLLVPAGG